MHRKILIIDQELILLGTANFTIQSLKMHDNLVLGIHDASLATFLESSVEDKGNFVIQEVEMMSFLLPDFKEEVIETLGNLIDQAQKTIQIAMFTLTHPLLVEKLTQALKRGIQVILAIDRYTAEGASKNAISKLREGGVALLTSTGSQLLHHKWALIDGETFVFGSTNWTAAAFSKNLDCLLVLKKMKKHHLKTLNSLWKIVEITSQKEYD